MRMIQKYEWGTIEWLTDQHRTTSDAVDIGITTILPKHAQQKHIHYGDEQWLYGLSGSGISVVDQVEHQVTVGTPLHIPAGAVHETRNEGDVPLIEILISYPKAFDDLWNQQKINFKSTQDLIDVSKQVHLTLSREDEEVICQIGETLSLPITIYDTQDQILFCWDKFPKPCLSLCQIDKGLSQCPIYKSKIFYTSPAYSQQSAHYCQYGLAIIDTPIVLDHQMVGSIRGGHLLTEDDMDRIHPELRSMMMNLSNVPKGRLRIILNQYKKLAEELAHSYQNKYRNDHATDDPSIHVLKEDLDLALGRILNLQINHHFLFNTLNALAGLALEEGSFKTYRSIVDLSKLFRYHLRTSQEFVMMKEEIDYVTNYVALQRIRFGERLVMDLHVPEDCLKYYIPFNSLQPVLENAFIHGFRNHDGEMKIAIESIENKGNIELHLKNNGKGMMPHEIIELDRKLSDLASPNRGLSMVVMRMRLFFGEGFNYRIISEGSSGFEIIFIFPKRTLKEGML